MGLHQRKPSCAAPWTVALVRMRSRLARLLLAASCTTRIVTTSASDHHHPDPEAAQSHAFALFNSIHSAMRQWGSSVHHNGMSFYLAQAPEGSVFYHGTYTPDPPWAFDWLAFEFEHAGIFAESWEPPAHPDISFNSAVLPSPDLVDGLLLRHHMSHRQPPPTAEHPRLSERNLLQHPLSTTASDGDEDRPLGPYLPIWNESARGYLHMYRAARPLNLLYIDGEAAAKCSLGPIDSQDLILLDADDQNGGRGRVKGDVQRARGLCALAEDWSFAVGGRIDGFVRMEAGFEIIYCDWTPKGGLELLSMQGSPFRNETGIDDPAVDIRRSRSSLIRDFEWVRSAAQRFHGHPDGRIEVDWSSMVSAFAYPLNLTNPDWSRQDLPRLINTTREERRNVRARLRDVVIERGGRSNAEKDVVDWQGVVDKIVTRFSTRLWSMANGGPTRVDLIATIGTLIDPFTDYLDHSPMAEELATTRCKQHYLDPQELHPETWTPEDHAIAAAVGAVSSTICTSLFSARRLLRSNDIEPSLRDDKARSILKKLVQDLRWSMWKECEGCAADEICWIPMFPLGATEDYFHPSCKNLTEVVSSRGYFGFVNF